MESSYSHEDGPPGSVLIQAGFSSTCAILAKARSPVKGKATCQTSKFGNRFAPPLLAMARRKSSEEDSEPAHATLYIHFYMDQCVPWSWCRLSPSPEVCTFGGRLFLCSFPGLSFMACFREALQPCSEDQAGKHFAFASERSCRCRVMTHASHMSHSARRGLCATTWLLLCPFLGSAAGLGLLLQLLRSLRCRSALSWRRKPKDFRLKSLTKPDTY